MDDSNCWDCSVCTFRNSAEAFKCLMCDVRKGTSTRKPRINPEMVAKQVARQQEQIKQQALKSAVKSKPGSSDKIGRRNDDTNSNSSIASTSSSGRNSPIANGSYCSSNSVESTSNAANTFFDNLSTKINTASSSKALSLPSSSSKTNDSDEEVDENEEFEGQSTPVTVRNGKAGRKSKSILPRAKLKNVDRTDVRVKEVTVNNITVVITEFKLKRKFSEVSDNHARSPNTDSPPKKAKSESGSRNVSPEKSSLKDANTALHRSKGLPADKKTPSKGARSSSSKLEEPSSNSKKRMANSTQPESSDHSHISSASSKKTAALDGN